MNIKTKELPRFSGQLFCYFKTFWGLEADLVGVQDQVGVKDFLDALHQAHGSISQGFRQVLDLAETNAVFPGNLAAQIGAFGV